MVVLSLSFLGDEPFRTDASTLIGLTEQGGSVLSTRFVS